MENAMVNDGNARENGEDVGHHVDASSSYDDIDD